MASETDKLEDADLDAWLAALRGEEGEGEDAELGARIRRVVRAEQTAAEGSIDEQQLEHGKERLMFRLAQESAKRRRVFWPQSPMALAASVALVAMVAVFTFTNTSIGPDQDPSILLAYGEVDQMRGVLAEPEVIAIAEPDEASRSIAARLRDLQVPFVLKVDPANDAARELSIQIDGVERRDALLTLLKNEGIEIPDQSVLVVRFVEPD